MKRSSSSQLALLSLGDEGLIGDLMGGGTSTLSAATAARAVALGAMQVPQQPSRSPRRVLPTDDAAADDLDHMTAIVTASGPAEQEDMGGDSPRDIDDDRPKKKTGPGRPRKDAGLTPEQRKHRRCVPPGPLAIRCT